MHPSARRVAVTRAGAMTAGLFLAVLLAGVAVLGALGDRAGGLRSPAGEAALNLLWEGRAAPGTVGRLSPGGLVFLWEPAGGGTRLRVVSAEGSALLSRDLTPNQLCLLQAGDRVAEAFLLLRAVPGPGGDGPYGETVRLETSGGSLRWQYAIPAGALLTAAAAPDGRRLALASLQLDRARPESRLHLLDGEGGLLVRLNPEGGVIVRLALSPDGECLAAGEAGALHYADCRRGDLWTRPLRGELRDLGLLSHGGPVALTATALYAYDARGGVLWRRFLAAPGVALATAPGILVVATRAGITGFREDGRRAWQWSGPSVPRSLSLSADGARLLVVGEDGWARLYQIAGIEPAPGEDRSGDGG